MKILRTKFSLYFYLSAFVLVAGVLALAPKATNVAKSESCSNAPTVATLNFFPVTWSMTAGFGCTDFAPIAVHNLNNTSYAPSDSAAVGDEVFVRIYIHNGAQQGLDPNQTTARSVNGTISLSGSSISTTFSGSNTNTVSGSVTVNIPAGATLQIEPGTGQFFDFQANPIGGQDNLTSTGGSFSMGDMPACFEFSRFFRFKAKVTGPAPANGSMLITKLVRDVTQNGSFSHAITAQNGDLLEYQITLKAGNSTVVNNVNVTDTFLTSLNYVSGSLTVNGQPHAPGLTSGGIGFATLTQSPIVIDYQANVAISSGTIINTANATADNAPSVSDQAQVTVNTVARQVICSYVWGSPLVADGSGRGDRRVGDPANLTEHITGLQPGQTFDQINQHTSGSPTVTLAQTADSSGNFNDVNDQTIIPSNYLPGDYNSFIQVNGQTVANCTGFRIEPPTPPQGAVLSIAKQVQDLTANGSYSSSVTANQNDAVQYKIVVTNTSNIAANNVVITDNFANAGVSNLNLVSVSKNFTGGLSSGINVSSLQPSDNVVVIFTGTVTLSQGTVNNTATASASNANQVSASASVTVSSQASALIRLVKQVRNVSNNESFSHSTFAKTGDTVEYQITVSPANGAALNNILVTDTFLTSLNYISGSLTVNGQPHAPGLTSGGLTFSSLGANSQLVIKYQATVAAASGNIINTATATAQNASNTASDQAQVSVSVVPPGQPSLTITKQVQNLGPSQTTGYSGSVNAKRGDTVQYQIVVKNVGGADARNVFISDSNPLPPTNVTVSKNFTGSLPSGIALSTLAASDSVTITYQASVNIDNGQILNLAAVSADNSATKNASAVVNVNTQQNPGNNININQNCVNNSCNTSNVNNNYSNYVYTYGSVNPSYNNNVSQLSIAKHVRLANGGTFQHSVTASNNDTVEFEIIVTNTGNQAVNNVVVSDTLNNGLIYNSGSLNVSGASYNGNYGGNYYGNNLINGSLNLGSLGMGQQIRITFQTQVSASGSASASIQNIAKAWGDSASQVQDDAWVFVNPGNVLGGNVNLIYSKRAVNETKNADATAVSAAKEDFITYTLTVSNTGNAAASNFVITDDLSQVLTYADMVDRADGTLNGSILSFPGITVPAGGSVSKSFKVRVKFSLADNLRYTMANTYGNTISININSPQILGAFTAPKTGADTTGLMFGGLLTSGFALIKHRKTLLKLIFA